MVVIQQNQWDGDEDSHTTVNTADPAQGRKGFLEEEAQEMGGEQGMATVPLPGWSTQEGTACVASGYRMRKDLMRPSVEEARPDRRLSPLPGWEPMVGVVPKIWLLLAVPNQLLENRVLGEIVG